MCCCSWLAPFAVCPPLRGNSVRKQVFWKGDPNLSSLAAKPVQVQIELRNADPFALQFLD